MTPGAQLARRTRDVASPADIKLQLLNGFSLIHGGRPAPLPIAAQRLVAFLALQERPVRRHVVAGSLWMDSTEDKATAALRTTLWRLGRIAPATISADDRSLALGANVVVDVREVEESARRIIRGSARRDDDQRLVATARELLPDWYEDWVLTEHERFRQLRQHALETLCGTLAAAGRFAEATEVGLAAIAAEPLRESAHRSLVAVYLAEGNPGQALRHYEKYREMLVRELGLRPSPLMDALVAPARKP
jgi:DNA-binding SARP family transcriptional activator